MLHVIARLNDGGPVRAIAGLVRALPDIQQHVLCGRCGPGEPDARALVVAAGATVIEEPALGRSLAPAADLMALRAIRQRIAALTPDVVHTHTAKAGMLGRLACRWAGARCLHTYHGHVLTGYFPRLWSLAATQAERWAAGTAWHQALTPSQAEELSGRLRIGRPARWRVLPPPVTPVVRREAPWRAQLRPGRHVVLFLGRLVPVKDPLLFLAALAQLDRCVPVQGLVCGAGPLADAVRARAAQLPLPVLCTGQTDPGAALAAADLVLMTSRNEGLPLAAVEAAGAGVPVVAPPVGGLADLIAWGAVTGAARAPAALAEACALLLTTAAVRARSCARAQAVAARLTPEALAPAYRALYAQVRRRP